MAAERLLRGCCEATKRLLRGYREATERLPRGYQEAIEIIIDIYITFVMSIKDTRFFKK